jgi:DNA-binding response OmpR family regulator
MNVLKQRNQLVESKLTMAVAEQKPRVAVVDDDESILEICQIILESENYEVDTYTSGKELYNLKEPLPDVVVLDVLLAGEDGRDICMFLKRQPETASIPVILFSAHAKAEIRELMPEETRPDKFIAKPFEIDELTQAVRELLT